MATTATAHIWLDERGVAWIDDTNTKVIEVAQDMMAHGWSPEEIHFQHNHLSLAQIHAALGFYYDHRDELNDSIDRSLIEVEKLRAKSADSPIRKRTRIPKPLTPEEAKFMETDPFGMPILKRCEGEPINVEMLNRMRSELGV